MADTYWIANGAAAPASTSTNWAPNPDGTGTGVVPVAGDVVYLGHNTTWANNKGSAPCTWDVAGAPDLTSMNILKDYRKDSIVTLSEISFLAPNTINNISLDWNADVALMVGQQITISGAATAPNNGTFTIASITNEIMTVTVGSLLTEAAGNSITVTGLAMKVNFTANAAMNLLDLNGTIEATGSAIQINLGDGSSGHESGANQRYVLNGDFAEILNDTNITYNIDGSVVGANTTFFDDGPHPITICSTATPFSPQYKATPTSTTQKTTFVKLQITNASATMVPVTGDKNPRKDFTKTFHITSNAADAFTFTPNVFDAGFSTWGFTATASGFVVPVSGISTYGSGEFVSHLYGLTILTGTAVGHKATLAEESLLSINSLSVQQGVQLTGEEDLTKESSVIMCVNRPMITGAWNFKQVTEGIYATMPSRFMLNLTPSGSDGDIQFRTDGRLSSNTKLNWDNSTEEFTIDGKLTVTGLIDPTGLELTPTASNPGGVTANTLWIDSGDSTLKMGSSAVSDGSYTDAEAVAAVEAEVALDLTAINSIGRLQATGLLTSGTWYNVAYINPAGVGERGSALFTIHDRTSSHHQTVWFMASHHFGKNSSITVLFDGSYNSTGPFQYIRIISNGTPPGGGANYDGAVLQVYVDSAHASQYAYYVDKIFDPQDDGWNNLAWTTADPGVTNYATMTEDCKVDLDKGTNNKTAFITTGSAHFQDEVEITGNVGFYGSAPASKTAVADIVPTAINPAGGPAPAADHASTAAAVAALESKLNALLDSLQAIGLV